MKVSRRSFLKYCIGSATALGLDLSILGALDKVIGAGKGPPVIWLNGANCTGCTVSLANRVGTTAPVDVADLLVNTIDLAFHPNLMAAAGDLAVQTLRNASTGDFILAVDGGIPTAFGGHTCMLWTEDGREITALEAVSELAPRALATLAIGTCASFGGIPAAAPNVTGVSSVREITGVEAINIPGCPTHPDWVVWTIAQLLAGKVVELDGVGRPMDLFGGDSCNVHKKCPRKGTAAADTYGLDGRCLKNLGCKGPKTQADCPVRLWNNGTNWCVGANAVCIGCTEKDFPDRFSPFYASLIGSPASELQIMKAEWKAAELRLQVEGVGTPGAIVSIGNSGSGLLMGTASVAWDGKWRFRMDKPDKVPCRIQAESNGMALQQDVLNAPANCDDGSNAGATPFEITKAEWRADKSELKVEGKAKVGEKVVVKNANTGATLGQATADSTGKWKFVLRKPSQVPCRVQAEWSGKALVKDVKNAPKNCG